MFTGTDGTHALAPADIAAIYGITGGTGAGLTIAVVGIAPSATILYAYATDVIVATQTVIDQNLAPILSFSFGTCEPNISSTDADFLQGLAQQANAQGQPGSPPRATRPRLDEIKARTRHRKDQRCGFQHPYRKLRRLAAGSSTKVRAATGDSPRVP